MIIYQKKKYFFPFLNFLRRLVDLRSILMISFRKYCLELLCMREQKAGENIAWFEFTLKAVTRIKVGERWKEELRWRLKRKGNLVAVKKNFV